MRIPFVGATDATLVGLIVGRSTDVATGAAVHPAPALDPEVDWMYSTRYYAIGTGAATDIAREVNIDIRSKRKMDEVGQVLLLTITNNNAAAANYMYFSRVLFALP
jgi:hypothetical protein